MATETNPSKMTSVQSPSKDIALPRTLVKDKSNPILRNVDAKELKSTVRILKLMLQKKQLNSKQLADMAPLLFTPYNPNQEVTIGTLRAKFDALGFKSTNSTLLARFLIETISNDHSEYNENLKA